MSWRDEPFACLDTETTGVSTATDRIVTGTVALVPKAAGGPRPPKLFQWLANPGIEIPKGASDIHGITTEHAVKNGRPAVDVVEDITDLLAFFIGEGVPIVGANLQYDLTLLDRDCRRNGVKPLCERVELVAPIIDVMVIDKAADPFRGGSRKLTALAEHYEVRLEGAHDATADALAAGRIAWKMAAGPIKRTPPRPGRKHDGPPLDIGGMKLSDLHELQVGWKAKQAKDLAAYFKREGKPYDDVRPEWPYIPIEHPSGTDGKLF